MNRWHNVAHNPGHGSEYVFGDRFGWYTRTADGRRRHIRAHADGRAVLTVTVPYGWEVERCETFGSVRAAKAAGGVE